MIPGTKGFLKRILKEDYNKPIQPKEPKKPNSLNMFLQFRKDVMDNNEFYKNTLPPQEGLYTPDPQDIKERQLQDKAKGLMKNLDFRILDADTDIEDAKKEQPSSLQEEDEVMDQFEQNYIKRKGRVFKTNDRQLLKGYDLVSCIHAVR